MKILKSRLSKNRVVLLTFIILAAAIALFLVFGGVDKTKKAYYGYKSRSALSNESRKLGDPLRALGFTNIEGGKSICQHMEKAGYTGKPLDCTTELKSYVVFADDASKTKAIGAAEKLSSSLKQNGWQQGNYEVGKWFKDVLNKVDYNPDAYHYKYFGNTFCVLDFFVAYSNPKPPAVNADFRCTVPEIHPPIY